VNRNPNLDELVGAETTGAERERLQHVHDLLLEAGPPPELSPELEAGPKLKMTVGKRRRVVKQRALLLLAAALTLSLIFLGGYAVGDQRHRAVLNGIWQMKYGFQLSGVYFFGSGERFANICGCGLRLGAGNDTLMPDGSFIARNSFVGKPIHRADVRLLKSFALGARRRVDGMLDLFNAFNHAQFNNPSGNVSSSIFGQVTTTRIAARITQLSASFNF